MYNLMKTSMQNARVVSIAQCSIRVCSFCNFYHLKSHKLTKYTLLRHYATTDAIELHSPWKKKTKRRSKKYAELMEVTDQTTNSKKAAVRKLNSAHVSMLVGQPDVTLDKLHKVPNFSFDKKTTSTQAKDTKADSKKDLVYAEDKTDNVHCNILEESDEYLKDKSTVVEDLKEYAMSDNTMLIKDSTFLDTLQNDKSDDEDKSQIDILTQISKYDEVSNPSAITAPKKEDHSEDSLSTRNLISHLRAHMDVYIQIQMPHRAFKILMLNKDKFKHSKISIIALYNLLMETYVSNGHLEKALEIYRLMKINSVEPNPRTYAFLFEIIGRMKNEEKRTEYATEVTGDMSRRKISFDDLMNTQMNTMQRNAVLYCIEFLDPQYRVRYRKIDSSYNCKLLHNLVMDSYRSPANGVTDMNELRNMVCIQSDMEKQCELKVNSIAPFTGDSDVRKQAIKRIAEWEKSWKSVVTHAFERNLAYQKQKELMLKPDLKALYPFLQVLPKKEYINAILREINQLTRFSDAYSTSMTNLYIALGTHIYKKYQFQRKMKAGVIENSIQIYEKYLQWYMQKKSVDKSNGRTKWQQLAQEAKHSGICSEMIVPEWPRNVLLNVGEFLYKIILNDVKISHVPKPDTSERQIPAFYALFRKQTNNFLTEEIKPHPYLHRLYKDSHPETLTFETVLLPTCSPPRPWIDIDTGGYLFSKTSFIRDPYMTPTILLRNTPMKQLYPAFDCLNQLGSIPWRINVPMLDILIKIFREGGSEKLDVPQSPSSLPSLSELITSSDIDKSKKMKLAFQLRRKKNEMYALWCDSLYKLSVANHFRDKVFWLPHNLDFRGRAYPVPPHLTHLASDLSRSILLFAQGKPLGPKGLDWLKIHTINLTGMKKKESIDQRLKFANEILDLIVDSARNPLTGEMWWTKSDEPWQTLAACKEIDNALQSPDVEKYICRLPIHQDGSCNGLQHYAALGRDQIGAESVNLYPSNTPQDVYSVVANMVDEYRKIDAEAGDKVAKALEGFVTRKVIKQTVMTTVYGVTKFGGRLQIARQLSDLKEFNQDYTWSGSLYLVEKTFQSLRTMFTGAKEIQDWFTDCARVISTRCNQYVQWVTPLGLPVLQPYFKRVKSANQNKLVRKPDTMKQKNAFPPNFIHSLDSSHMMLTSLYCEQAGITFMSVHDCFWTHACTVDIMNRICREQFIALHREPILEDLSQFLFDRYAKYFTSNQRLLRQRDNDISMEIFKKLPKKGNFEIKKVQSSQYFFS
ncbi:DNA-directed RNA polymerase, mitochondrial isoform X1 [Camponotus floridanus]|uniref:DNA-directed RNA polymerase, mitochondrial isoform X1 n=2 Tax=Camponotus floridanus TaxID=104421 RepID=UPI000DC67271|nr:DNA-directed RNA polymerase, mitochondrial isoform X1 [Camponotus floridanus]